MAFTSWLSATLQPRRRTNRTVARPTTRLLLEQMEDRVTPAVIVEAGVGLTGSGYGGGPGQSVTTPAGGPWVDVTFNFYDRFTGAPQAEGNVYLFGTPYTGTPQNLSLSTPGLLGVGMDTGSVYSFPPSLTLLPNTQYFFYADTLPGGAGGTTVVGNIYAGGTYLNSGNGNLPFSATASADTAFSLQGTSLAISSLSPPSAIINGGSFLLTVTGTQFQNDSVVQWNGVPLATTYVGSTQLTAVVPVGNLGVPYGSANITVLNPTTAPGTSAPKLFYLNRDTPAATTPTVTSPTSTAISSGSGTLGGTVAADNGSIIQKRGVLYAPTANNATLNLANVGVNGVIQVEDPAVGNGMAGTLVGSFTRNITGLNGKTSYSMVAYATNDIGTTYTPVTTFGSLSIASLNPTRVAINGPLFTLNINGSGFQSDSVVNWNGAPLAAT